MTPNEWAKYFRDLASKENEKGEATITVCASLASAADQVEKMSAEIEQYQELAKAVIEDTDCECEMGDYGQRHGSSCLRCMALNLLPTKDNESDEDIEHDDATRSELLQALYEWQNAGGSIDRVISAMDERYVTLPLGLRDPQETLRRGRDVLARIESEQDNG